MDADDLLVGFAEENGGRVIINLLDSEETSFIPEGLIHFEINMGCKPAYYLSTYSNVDPGLTTISSRSFQLPLNVLKASYYLREEQINFIKKNLPRSPAFGSKAYGMGECHERCKTRSQYQNHTLF